MNIQDFFELSSGKWFSHRTSHHLAFKQAEDGKSDIVIEMLPPDHPEVVKLCQQYEIDPALAAGGAKVSSNSTTVLVPVPDADNPSQGKLLLEIGETEKATVSGRYVMGTDQALTLFTEDENMSSQERLWFASPNLRMRVGTVKQFGGLSTASFTSEIRMGGVQPSAKAVEAFNQGRLG